MATPGDPTNINSPVAQRLLHSNIPARLAFVGADGSPRVTPIWFHWDGEAVIMSTLADSPKVKAIRRNPRLAVTIDTEGAPYQGLTIRGTATIMEAPRATAEYEAEAVRYLGEELGAAWLAMMGHLPQVRIALRPEWVDVFDRSAVMERALGIYRSRGG